MALITLATLRDYWKKVYDNIVAHDAADSGDPLKVGGKASTAAPTAVAVNDRVNAWFDLNGRLVVFQDQASALPTGAATSAKQDSIVTLLTGVITAPAHTVVAVTAATGVALASNANRKYALLVNDSATDQYIKMGAGAVLNQGIRMNAGGGSYEISSKNGNLYTGAINIISSSAGNALITEG